MSFKKVGRSYYSTPNGWRLATFEEATKGLDTIKQQGLLNKWDRVRLLDGWMLGPGYDFQMGNDFKGCLGYMLLIQTQAAEIQSGTSPYHDVHISDSQKQVALFLCADDWNLEVLYWLINSWTKTQSYMVDLSDVREGNIPFTDATNFKEMNKNLSSLARKLGDVGPVSEKAAKRKFSGEDSVKDVLSDMINIVDEENFQQYYSDDRSDEIDEWKKSCFPSSLGPTWLNNVAWHGDAEWNTIADAMWNFLSESFAGTAVEMFASLSLAEICKPNNQCDLKTITSSQKNFIVASSILFYLSFYRLDIIHAPLSHRCSWSCAQEIISYVAASNNGAVELQRFNQTLPNNAMWKCYDPIRNYDLLNKLLICAAAGSGYLDIDLNMERRIDSLVVNRLLECGARPGTTFQIRGWGKRTALRFAVTWEDKDLVKEVARDLFTKCADGQQQEGLANAKDENGWTPLHIASKWGPAHVCQMLLNYGATLDVQDNEGRTPLHCALDFRNHEVANVLMQQPQITEVVDLKDRRGHTPIDVAVDQEDIELVAKLLSKSKQAEAYFNKVNREQLLRESLLNGWVDSVEMLLEKGTKPSDGDGNDEGKTVLHLASMCDDQRQVMDMVRTILQKNQEHKKFVAKCDRRGRTALHEAALKGHAYVCEKFLDTDPKLINNKDRDGRNPLYDAVKAKQNEVVVLKMLLRAYSIKDMALDDLMDRRGVTLLHLAASQGKSELVTQLLSNAKSKTTYLTRGDFLGQTALLKAAKRGDLDTVKILLKYGADPLKERDCDGRTALHYAVQSKTEGNKEELVHLLLQGCKSDEKAMLLLWASAAGLGTAEQNLRNNDSLRKFLVDRKTEITKNLGTPNLLRTAASLGDMEMTKELITRGGQIEDIHDPAWRKGLTLEFEKNVERVSRTIQKIAEQGNDQPTISDNLGRSDYAQGLAALFLNPYLKPPIAVGISGSWGMGKSSLMVQTESMLLTTAAQMALLPSSKLSSSDSEFLGIKSFGLSKKGAKKYEEIKTQINYGQKVNRNIFTILMDKIKSRVKQSEKGKTQEKDSLMEFLNNYELKYRKVFKSLAAMDSSDMFTTKTREDEEPQRSYSKIMWDMVTFKTDASRPKIGAQRLKSEFSGEGNVPAVLTIQYNAWKYRNDTEALAGMAVEITKELEGIMTKPQWLSTCWRNTWKKKKSTIWIELFFPCLLALVLACLFTWIAWVVFDSDKFKEWAKAKYAWPPAAIVIIVWTLTKSVMGILKPVSTQLINYISFPDHTDKLGYQERVISDITFLKDEIGKKPFWVSIFFNWVFTTLAMLWHLITELWVRTFIFNPVPLQKAMEVPKLAPASGSNLRIIVFVDDLDRCQESVILQVLSAINLVLAVCDISVVLGMDKELIERAITKKYGDKSNKSLKASKELADKYLQKIIQLPLDLPDPSKEQSTRFLKGQLGVFEEATRNDKERDATNRTSMPGERSIESVPTGEEEREDVPQNTGAAPEITINVPTASEITQMDATSSAERSVPVQTGQEAPSQIGGDTSITSNKNYSSSILVREMLFVTYSQGEQDAFCYLQELATDCRKLPREWKRLLNYHRLVWYIFTLSNEAKVLAGWQVQLITWIFICWEWEENMNFLIENWNNLGVLKTEDSNGPSLLMIVEYFMENNVSNKNKQMTATTSEEHPTKQEAEKRVSENTKQTKSGNSESEQLEEAAKGNMARDDDDNCESFKRTSIEILDSVAKEQPETLSKEMKEMIETSSEKTLDNLKKEINDLKKEMKEIIEKNIKEMIEQALKQNSGKNEEENVKGMKMQSWRRMRSALYRYDVSMEGIQAFQRFRFYCKAGYLPWPPSKQEYNEGAW